MNMKKKDELIDKLAIQFKYNLNIDDRSFLFTNDINRVGVKVFHNLLSTLESLDNSKPITVYFSSDGGDIYDMFSIISRIKSSPCTIIMKGIGAIQSAAVLIFASADVRYISKYATFMVHHIQFGLGTSRSEAVRNEIKHTDDLEKRMFQLLADNTKKPVTFWKKTGKLNEEYVDSYTAIKLGLADEILEEVEAEVESEPKK